MMHHDTLAGQSLVMFGKSHPGALTNCMENAPVVTSLHFRRRLLAMSNGSGPLPEELRPIRPPAPLVEVKKGKAWITDGGLKLCFWNSPFEI